MSLAQALAFIDDDLVEVTPLSVRLCRLCRLCKLHLTENDRKRAFRSNKE